MSTPSIKYQYCEHCLCTRNMKVLDNSGTQCVICGTEKPPRIKEIDCKNQNEIEAQWQRDWGNE